MCGCSQHPAALMHATARAVSGSSVYVSDFPGLHDFDLLRRLVLSDGRVLRAQLPGRPTRDSLFCDVLRDGKSLLKVAGLLKSENTEMCLWQISTFCLSKLNKSVSFSKRSIHGRLLRTRELIKKACLVCATAVCSLEAIVQNLIVESWHIRQRRQS